MFPLAIVGLILAGYLIDSGVKGRNPITTLVQIVQDPANAQKTIKASGKPLTQNTVAAPAAAPTAAGASVITPQGTGGPADTAAGAVAFARAQIGKPYKYGATGPDSYDCSGLCWAAYQSVGVKINRTSSTQLLNGTMVGRDSLLVGDLVWPHLGHVGIYSGLGNVIEAPHTGTQVKEVPLSSFGFLTARRIIATHLLTG